jgi:hypothetical protein
MIRMNGDLSTDKRLQSWNQIERTVAVDSSSCGEAAGPHPRAARQNVNAKNIQRQIRILPALAHGKGRKGRARLRPA